ncbi:cytochrome c oxidase subunit II [Symbiobacterium terraclitae]|uniref:cytochrome c oxidase subunit II n=1 Tax=Symbiobacterium terraclitae TaxID=557451 RepID=UPI0035B5584F
MRTRLSGAVRAVLIPLVGALLAGCSTLPQTPLDPKGPVAQTQTGLLLYTLYVAVGIGVGVTAALLYVVFRFRARPGQVGVPLQIRGNHTLEIIWTIIPILILISVAFPTVEAAISTSAPPSGALTVRATGYRWWFAFEYPELGIVTANELRIPAGRPVRLEITSNDVIHSFWVPKLAGKTDMIPGRINVTWMQADEPDVYLGQCAEFCGDSHANMRFRVVAMSQADFDAWVTHRQAMKQGPGQLAEAAAAGKALFESPAPGGNCLSCHTVDGTPAQGKVGPNLTDVGQRSTIAAGILENDYESLKAWVKNPTDFKPGTTMPSHARLSEKDLDAIVQYLQSLK